MPTDRELRLLLSELNRWIDDPMWADHAEVPKRFLKRVHAALAQPTTIEQVRKRFDQWYDGEMPEEVPNRFVAYWIWLTALNVSDIDYQPPKHKQSYDARELLVRVMDEARDQLPRGLRMMITAFLKRKGASHG